VSTGRRLATAIGAACAFAVLLSPAIRESAGEDVILPSVLPLGFLAAGGTAQVLRPAHPVGDRLLAVGVLHLVAIVAALLATLVDATVAGPIALASAVLYALGFVALLDLLARYPTGAHAWPAVGPAVRITAVGAVVTATLAVLADPRTPSVLGLDADANPLHVPALAGLTPVVAVVMFLPVAGFLLLVARYPGAPPADRAQMRWPMVTAAVIVAGLLTTGIAESTLGPDTQTAVFITAGAALPVSFLVGLLRHTGEAERLAAVEASRARLAAVADAERRRIERNLHDGAQQQLLALLVQVELTRAELGGWHEDIDRGLRGIGDGLRSVHHDLRELAQGLYPSVLSDHGLAEAVRSALGRLPVPAGLSIAPAVNGKRYPEPVEGAAYFLVLEGLANAMKHGGLTAPEVALSEERGQLQVTVRDAGRGFDPAAAPGGSGLVGLSDRLAAAGGRLDIDSRPGAGTVLRGLLPAAGRG
jgi:signal transduction histidine kinase